MRSDLITIKSHKHRMAFRNRTPAFLELRSQSKNHRPYNTKKDTTSTIPLIGVDDPNAVQLETLNVLPKWIRINDIDIKLRIIAERVEKLGKLHTRNLETFESNTEDEREIEILTKEIAMVRYH
ncbi:hypothetical protein PPL_10695 [Heterostelium album PN500]|uniref:Uncharacterized protein n=1 Tax=Heterostelium pallidum (strain ATCC 26659 / Pp 5 / PN500) TaxID=670386 RepID=D3BRT4_HETP5|nr:hypothetical protein PPL_10695 [Heterostelium album PN500]EFA76116.1 hypothetical protein PPL_10695 [Heterostelium album PN500]|eukprot:XP_020428250.1 hypothetical protein PPL_10695 [Heterostelium album PN500]